MSGILAPSTVATESPYWNPKTETLDRERIEALQLAKLRRQCEWAAARSPWYQRRFAAERFDPAQLTHARRPAPHPGPDPRRLDGLAGGERRRTARSRRSGVRGAIRIHTTSGTTGRGPLRALDSRKDWAWIAEMWCYGIWGCGVRSVDTAYIAFGYGSFIGFWGLHYAMEKVGVLNVPGGAQTTEARVLQIVDFGATVVASTPTYALRLAQEADRARGRPARLEGQPADPVRRAGGVDPADQGADRGAVGRQGVRHRGHDRDRHDHGVRVLAPARRDAHHRGPRDRGGARSGDARSRWRTASAASGS